MVYQSNSNRQANPFAPMSAQAGTRMRNPGQNPSGYGMQRVAGQLAPQRAAQGYQSNTGMAARIPSYMPPTAPTSMPQMSRPDLGMLYGNGQFQMPPNSAFLQKGQDTIDPLTGEYGPMGPASGPVDWANPHIRNDVNAPPPTIINDPNLGQPNYADILRALGYGRPAGGGFRG